MKKETFDFVKDNGSGEFIHPAMTFTKYGEVVTRNYTKKMKNLSVTSYVTNLESLPDSFEIIRFTDDKKFAVIKLAQEMGMTQFHLIGK